MGCTLPALAGIWSMASSAVLDYAGPACANDRIIGPIVASLAIIVISEIARPAGALVLDCRW
jgi:hypothetical protein